MPMKKLVKVVQGILGLVNPSPTTKRIPVGKGRYLYLSQVGKASKLNLEEVLYTLNTWKSTKGEKVLPSLLCILMDPVRVLAALSPQEIEWLHVMCDNAGLFKPDESREPLSEAAQAFEDGYVRLFANKVAFTIDNKQGIG